MVVVIENARPFKCGIVTDDDRPDALGDGTLPSVVLAHTARASLLERGCGFRVHAMNSLPSISRKIGLHGDPILGTIEHLGERDGTDPKPRSGVALQPRDRRSVFVVRDFVQEIY